MSSRSLGMMRSEENTSAGRRQSQQRLPVNPRRHKVAPENRKRVATACNACNIRRVKCSGESPCRQCRSSARDCVYPVSIAKASLPRAELDDLRRKVDLLERALRDTVPDADRRHQLLQGLDANVDAAGVSLTPTMTAAAASNTGSSVVGTPSVSSPIEAGQAVAGAGGVAGVIPHQSQPSSHSDPHSDPNSHPSRYQTQPQLENQTQTHKPSLVSLHNSTAHQSQNHDEEQASTEGRLLNDPDGHARFLGETSGATFLDYLKEFMSTIIPLAYHNIHPSVGGTTFLSTRGIYQTYDSRPIHDRDVDPFWLPCRPDMQAMLSELRFFIQDGNGNWPSGGIYWWGDVSSVPSSPTVVDSSEPSSLRRPHANRHLAFYNTAFAVVSQASVNPETPPQPKVSEHYFGRACALLGNPLDINRFTTDDIRVLTLMGFYLIEMNRRDAAYMCVSNAMHISIMHGAHRGWVDENGKRVFWTLYVLDRWLSCLMGRPPTIMDDAIRLSLPCDAPSMPPAAGLKAHVELSRISGYIVCNTYLVSPWDNNPGPVRRPEDALRMLDQWLENLPPILQLSETRLSDDPACSLLHMGYNQLVILTIRPVFFAAVKKTFAERHFSRQSSLNSHPRLALLRRCISAAELNIRLARHILALNSPRKLLQAGLHFIFNAAICIMLQELLYAEYLVPKDPRAREHDIDFVIARFEEESQSGSNYGKDCATVLRDLRVLVHKLRAPMGQPGEALSSPYAQTSTTVDVNEQWPQKVGQEVLQQPIHIEQGHVLYEEMLSWIDDDWQSYPAYV